MASLGVFCLPMPSHMNLFLALARTLQDRGHQLTFFGISDNEKRVRDAGLRFQLLEPDSVPTGTLGQMMRQMTNLGSLAALRLQARFDELRYGGILSKGPRMVEKAGLDGLIVDQAEACSGSVAEATRLPWVSVCSGLCQNGEPSIPPFFTGWRYSDSKLAVTRNSLGYAAIKIASWSLQRLINRHRKTWGLKPLAKFDDTFSPFAQISQQVAEFDFPRKRLPDHFHYVGPVCASRGRPIDFPWELLDRRPLIYASLGTVVHHQRRLYQMIAEGCANLDAQLVLSLGGAEKSSQYDRLPGSPLVVSFAPQVELIRKAALTITHAGLNTTLESLTEGVPLVAIPITFEQPAIGARIQWTGVGETIPAPDLTPARLQTVVTKVLATGRYRESAKRMKNAIAHSGGAAQAATIIEEVVRARHLVPAMPRHLHQESPLHA